MPELDQIPEQPSAQSKEQTAQKGMTPDTAASFARELMRNTARAKLPELTDAPLLPQQKVEFIEVALGHPYHGF